MTVEYEVDEFNSILDTKEFIKNNPVPEEKAQEYKNALRRKQQGMKYDTSFFSSWENERQRVINPHLFD
jgi:hypothetical protein